MEKRGEDMQQEQINEERITFIARLFNLSGSVLFLIGAGIFIYLSIAKLSALQS